MTDTSEGLAYIPCLYDDGRPEQCGVMVEDTDESRRAHRAWHAQDKTVHERFRDSVKDRATKRELAAAIDELRRELAETLEGIKRDVGRIEVPAPVLPVKRSESGWSDADEPEETPASGLDLGEADDLSPEMVAAVETFATAPEAVYPAIDRDEPIPTQTGSIDPVTGLWSQS